MKVAALVAVAAVVAVAGARVWLDWYEARYLLEQARDRVDQPLASATARGALGEFGAGDAEPPADERDDNLVHVAVTL